jgi:hypothetical protein
VHLVRVNLDLFNLCAGLYRLAVLYFKLKVGGFSLLRFGQIDLRFTDFFSKHVFSQQTVEAFLSNCEACLEKRLVVVGDAQIVKLGGLLVEIVDDDQVVCKLESEDGPGHELNLLLVVVDLMGVKFDHEDLAEIRVCMQQHEPVLDVREQELVLLSVQLISNAFQVLKCGVVFRQEVGVKD